MKIRLLWIVFVLAWGVPLIASPEAGQAAHHFNWTAFAGRMVNSTLLFGGLFLLLKKPVATMLRKTSTAVQTDLVFRRTRADEAIAGLEAVALRLATVETEVEAIRQAARQRGQIEGERLVADGRVESERIAAQCAAETLRRVASARRGIRERIADELIARFSADIRAVADENRQQRILELNIDRCGEIHEAG